MYCSVIIHIPSVTIMVLGTARVSLIFRSFAASFLILRLFLRMVLGELATRGPKQKTLS